MTQQQIAAISELRRQGFAVIVWNPDELDGANPRKVEDRSIELGYEITEALKD